MARKARQILLVDDNPADIDLTSEAFSRSQFEHCVQAVYDGVEAMNFLHRIGKYKDASSPDLVILDLNLPRKDGRSVLSAVKSDPKLRRIPIVIFSTSESQKDIGSSYDLGANSYISKPGNLRAYVTTIASIGEYWLGLAHLPGQEEK
jgi:chemotaxis family two-component system response regulator Rcp1